MQYDPNISLLDQISKLDWPLAEHQQINCYQLSNFTLTFFGNPRAQSAHAIPVAQHVTDIDSDVSYPKQIGELELWNENTKIIGLGIATLSWPSGVILEDEYAVLGSSNMRIGLQQVRSHAFSKKFNILNFENFCEMLLERDITDNVKADNKTEKKQSDYQLTTINNREWLYFTRNKSLQRLDVFYTAITDKHFISVSCTSEGFWNAKTDPSPEQHKKVMEGFLNYLNNITISEYSDKKLAPGQHKNTKITTQEDVSNNDLDW